MEEQKDDEIVRQRDQSRLTFILADNNRAVSDKFTRMRTYGKEKSDNKRIYDGLIKESKIPTVYAFLRDHDNIAVLPVKQE
jgi:hypothetical protein